MLEVKLARNGLAQKTDLRTVKAGESVDIGPFKVDFFHVCHSIPDGVGVGIETPAGLIVHSGDYKFDHTPVDNWPTDYAKLAEFSERGVLALLSDSTNSERAGWTPSERVVDAGFEQVFGKARGRIIIASFASLISRMQQVANCAERYGRKMTFVGTSMQDNAKIARKLGYLDISDDLLVSVEQALNMPDNEVVLMCTGSQGEPTSILGRLSTGTNRLFDIKEGDTVVLSSHPIPGNEENVYRTINRLFQQNAEVIYEGIAAVHVSGHASQEEMKLLLHLTKPRYFIPIHGELRQLKAHAQLGEQVGIPKENIAVVENGQVIEFVDGKMELKERISNATVFVDGSGVGNIGPDLIREREALAQDGIVLVNIRIDKYTNGLQSDPEFITRGFIATKDISGLLQGVRMKIEEIVRRGNGNQQKDLEQAVKDFLYSETRRRPMIFITVNRI